MSSVSIMCCTHNRLELTKQTFDSLFSTTRHSYRLIVIDNGSKDGTPDYIKTLKPPKEWCVSYEYLLNDTNKGIASGRNQALKIAANYKDEYLSTLDNDILLPDNWLNECIDVLSVNPDFVLGVNVEPTIYPLQTINGKTFQVKPRGNPGTVCTVFHRHLFVKIGYFNTTYPSNLYASDDADYFMRSRVVGYKIGFIQEMGKHIGEGEVVDGGEYRIWKDKCHADNLATFRRNCHLYATGQKSYYLPYSEKQ